MKTQFLSDVAICFTENLFSTMTKNVNQWLTNAVSVPQTYHKERFYYDYEQHELFVIDESDANLLKLHHGNNKVLSNKDIEKLAVKTLKIAAEYEVIEIPRLDLVQRIAIQLDFISSIENFKFYDAFSNAINKQDQTQGFVLDDLLMADKKAYFFIDYWAEFKTEQLAYFINDLEDKYDVDFRSARIWE